MVRRLTTGMVCIAIASATEVARPLRPAMWGRS